MGSRVLKDINDYIEISHVKKYIDHNNFLNSWELDKIDSYKAETKRLFGLCAKYFATLCDNNVVEEFKGIDRINHEYTDQFWCLFETFKLYERISPEIIRSMTTSENFHLYEFLKYNKLVKKYGTVMRDYMLANNETAELLLQTYGIDSNHMTNVIFPTELSNDDKEKIICDYISSPNANPNYLHIIVTIPKSKDTVIISDLIKLNAKKRIKKEEGSYLEKGFRWTTSTTVAFSESQEEDFIFEGHDLQCSVTFGTRWIEDNLDSPTLLNNFIHLFGFVDRQMRCAFLQKPTEIGLFEKLMPVQKNEYRVGVAFHSKDNLYLLLTVGYYALLQKKNIRLEEIIEWFFIEYLNNEFTVENYALSLPSANSTYLEKCTSIKSAFEYALKQFSTYVRNSVIDHELLEIGYEPLVFETIPSIVKRKYAYPFGDRFKSIAFLLFSDQSALCYYKKDKKSYDSFFELLQSQEVTLADFSNFAEQRINYLIQNGYIETDHNGYIALTNLLKTSILHDLYKNEVVSYWWYPKEARKILDALEAEGMIEFEQTLFSRPEANYCNYCLNKTYSNGLDLRNQYAHFQPKGDDKTHYDNYIRFLKLFILTVIKINDDFCIHYDLEQQI